MGMALAEVWKEAWVHCTCGDSARLTGGRWHEVTDHQFLSDQPHSTEVVYEMSVKIVSAPLWAASVSAPEGDIWP